MCVCARVPALREFRGTTILGLARFLARPANGGARKFPRDLLFGQLGVVICDEAHAGGLDVLGAFRLAIIRLLLGIPPGDLHAGGLDVQQAVPDTYPRVPHAEGLDVESFFLEPPFRAAGLQGIRAVHLDEGLDVPSSASPFSPTTASGRSASPADEPAEAKRR